MDGLIIRWYAVVFVHGPTARIIRGDRVNILPLRIVASVMIKVTLDRDHGPVDVLIDILDVDDVIVRGCGGHQLAEATSAG